MRGRPLRWWRELAYVAAFYGVYSVIRNQFGSAAVSRAEALANADVVIGVERALGAFHEGTVQEWFLDLRWFIQGWNLFYGTSHFVVTTAVLVYLFRRWPGRYVWARDVLATTTALALVGFATFPLLPPRLLPASYGFVDTLASYGGLWSFDSGAVQAVSNQYAAMPSLHVGWSLWCALALLPVVRRRWAAALLVAYPVATLFATVVTANHFWLDGAGGAAALALGAVVASWRDRRRGEVGGAVAPGRPDPVEVAPAGDRAAAGSISS
ncbi:MAG: phosphatase PAP2 family protein [Acidimicrobiales bacterium]